MNHTIRRIEQVSLQSDPFPYFYIENIFEASGQRWNLILDQEHLIRLPFVQQLFWMKFCQAFSEGKLL